MKVYILEQKDLDTTKTIDYIVLSSVEECKDLVRDEDLWENLENSYFAIMEQEMDKPELERCVELIFDEEMVEEE